MCWINWYIKLWWDKSETEELIRNMNKSISHRWPDDEWIFIDTNSKYTIWLWHVRLSILDLSSAWHQPMHYQNLTIVFNWEIYNYKELKEDLIKKWYKFETKTDTEVILKWFHLEWEDFFKKLNWIFSIVIYDKNKLYIIRDKLWIKPLYYLNKNDNFVFSSEIKSIKNNFYGLIKSFNYLAIQNYLSKYSTHEESFYNEIKTIEPWELLIFDLINNTFLLNQFIDVYSWINKDSYLELKNQSEKELIDKLDNLINQIVKEQLISDAPISVICSWWIDSSLVTAISLKYNPWITIYNVSVDDKKLDENTYAQKIANHLWVNLVTIRLTDKDFNENFKKCINYNDLPLYHPNSVWIFKLFEKISQDWIKVVLTWEWADELFWWYTHYKHYLIFLRLSSITKFIKIYFLKNIFKFLYIIFSWKDYINSYFVNHQEYNDLNLNKDDRNWIIFNYLFEKYNFIISDTERYLNSYLALDLKNYLVPLLRRCDRMSMANSLEARVPFLDNRLVEFALNLPLKYKIKWWTQKYLLKKVAERYLPKDIVYRKKIWFALPLERWFWTKNIKNLFLNEWLNNNKND